MRKEAICGSFNLQELAKFNLTTVIAHFSVFIPQGPQRFSEATALCSI